MPLQCPVWYASYTIDRLIKGGRKKENHQRFLNDILGVAFAFQRSPSAKLSTDPFNSHESLLFAAFNKAVTSQDRQRLREKSLHENEGMSTRGRTVYLFREEHLFWENTENTQWLFQWERRMAEGRGSTLQIDSPSISKSKIYLLSSKER